MPISFFLQETANRKKKVVGRSLFLDFFSCDNLLMPIFGCNFVMSLDGLSFFLLHCAGAIEGVISMDVI